MSTADETRIKACVDSALTQDDFTQLINQIPYARMIGVKCQRLGDELLFILPQSTQNIGNPTLPAIHGGVIAAFLELSGVFQVMLSAKAATLPKVVDFSIDYIRAGHNRDTYAVCKIERQGRRVVNCSMEAWQGQRGEPIAIARAHFLLR
jgi:uncharacterized protein (TIGR00369 family)